MKIDANNVDEYIEKVQPRFKDAIGKLRDVILHNLPVGFAEKISYGMIGYVVPHSIYPNGYHCNPNQELPFINIAAQKNYISLYHAGIYADSELSDWFKQMYLLENSAKLDMGKSCIRFRNTTLIPYSLIGKLAKRITVADWIEIYEKNIVKSDTN